MKKTPEISVVMSVYNDEAYLKESIDSVLSQNFACLELIIVNDGSTDTSSHILGDYAQHDSRIKVINQENQGLTKALIKGCENARGTFIARHDVGDVSTPDRLALQKKLMDSNDNLSFVSSWTEYCGPNWEYLYTLKDSGYANEPSYIIDLSVDCGVLDGPTSHPSVMFKKEIYNEVGGYRSEFYFGQDWDLWYRLAEKGKFMSVKRSLYKARILPGSISNINKNKQKELGELSLKALKVRKRGSSDEHILTKASNIKPVGKNEKEILNNKGMGLYYIGECLRKRNDSRSAKYFLKALALNPWHIKSGVRLLQSWLISQSK